MAKTRAFFVHFRRRKRPKFGTFILPKYAARRIRPQIAFSSPKEKRFSGAPFQMSKLMSNHISHLERSTANDIVNNVPDWNRQRSRIGGHLERSVGIMG